MGLTAIVIGFTQMIKDTGLVNKKYIQLLAIAIGLALFAFAQYFPDIYEEVVALMVAVSAPGVYSAGKDISMATKTK